MWSITNHCTRGIGKGETLSYYSVTVVVSLVDSVSVLDKLIQVTEKSLEEGQYIWILW